MPDYVPVDFAKPLDEIIEQMAVGHDGALKVLKYVASRQIDQRRPLLPTLFDLDDMRMRGAQIALAWAYIDSRFRFTDELVSEFVELCSARDGGMVDYVNDEFTDRTARRHGPQKTLPRIDQAVQAAADNTGDEQISERLDDDAETIHKFFLSLFTRMQKKRQSVSNFHLNTGMEGIGLVTFAIMVCEIKAPDGSVIWALPSETPTTPRVQ